MIGGAMLLCAVGAMLLIARWSLSQDDMPDKAAQTGLLALRTPAPGRKERTQDADPARQPGRARKRAPPDKGRRPQRDAPLAKPSILSEVEAQLIEDELAEAQERLKARRMRRRPRTILDDINEAGDRR